MRYLWMSEVKIDRSRGLRIPETTTATCMSGRCVNDVLGGPGRNRTSYTRIFKTSVYFGRYQWRESIAVRCGPFHEYISLQMETITKPLRFAHMDSARL